MRLVDILPVGRANAVSTEALVAAGNYRSSRELQQDIRELRLIGVPIISISEAPGGYYISEDKEEILHCSRTLENRGRNTLQAAAALKEYIGG